MILNTRYTKKEFEKLLTEKLFNEFAIDIASATDEQIYRALALIARGMLSEKRKRFIARTYGANGKQVYYLCMEFLMGRSLKTSLLNLGLCGVADEVLRDYSMKLDNIYEQEPDAGLGNGGLGRLAACYLDGMATDDIPGTGYSILYEYGIFKQKIVDGWQQERADLELTFPGDEGKINYMAVLGDGQVRMANICCYVCHSINGVSQLHSEIIKQSVFHDYFLYSPEKFTNVTNGIAYRRWLLAANPGLTGLLEDTIGPGFKKDASELKKLEKFKADKKVLSALEDVKDANKVIFAQHLKKVTGQEIDPHTLFDVQVKRMHEYKRQHLNALNIAAQYLYIKNNPNADVVPKTYIFGAKAAPGYYMAKQMIRLICKLGALIDADPMVREKLRVVYLEDYNVTTSERLMPASEVSEQISLAGTEASGTGNMKFMLNGAVTLGTLDGANVEIAEAAGRENEIIFGMLTPEVNDLKRFGYHPSGFINNCPEAAEVLAFLERGWGGESFHEIVNNLRTSDPYMVMADFADYRRAQNDLSGLYRDRGVWNRMSLMNIANAGIFSADRAVNDYARDIWHVKPIK